MCVHFYKTRGYKLAGYVLNHRVRRVDFWRHRRNFSVLYQQVERSVYLVGRVNDAPAF